MRYIKNFFFFLVTRVGVKDHFNLHTENLLSTFENAAPTLLPTRAYPKTLILELCYFVRYFFVAPRRGPRVFIIILAAQKMRSRICLCHFHSFFVVVLSGL
eukprot:GEMP01077260.1.p2 GENE.GEMP01077260.1~~GEMP01077260.1.p2  ORF type:complete len:101 (+),score=2.55 GEMP01077260.1:324-626(+)